MKTRLDSTRPQGATPVDFSGVCGVSIDATGTLFHCPRLGELYSETLRRHGIDIPADVCAVHFRHAWLELDCLATPAVDRWASHPGGAKGWWSNLIRRVCALAEVAAPSDFAVAELFHRFTQSDAWQVYPDAVPFLAALRKRSIPCVLTSNWDHRLHRVVDGLELADFFCAVVCSEEVGAAKPAPAIFDEARRQLTKAGARDGVLLHVGDDPLCDVEGAQANGFEAVLIERPKRTLSELTAD